MTDSGNAFGAVVKGYDAVYGGMLESPTFARTWRLHALGGDYPERYLNIGFLTFPELCETRDRLGLGRDDTLADVACGAAGPSLWVANKSGAKLIGIDASERGVVLARTRAERLGLSGRCQFAVGTFAATGLADGVADAVMSVDALSYAPDKRAAVREMHRILRPGGRIVLWAFEVEPSRVRGVPVFGADPVADYQPLLAQAGFAVESYGETAGWEERTRAAFEALLAAGPALTEEMGERAAAAIATESAMTLEVRPYRRRILAVARG